MEAVQNLEQPGLWPITVDWELRFSSPQVQKALAHWQSLLGGRQMPARRELNPRAMKAFIHYVNLVDVIPTSTGQWDYVVALQSAHGSEILGDVKGRRFAEIFPPAMVQRWRGCFDLPRRSGAPVRLLTRASTQRRNWLACEALLAPLGEGQEVTAIFWVFIAWPATD
jgi:hypothetical protein